MDAAELKVQLKRVEEHMTKAAQIRLHRAISWLARAESEDGDPDARFIFLWISFNAAYAHELGWDTVERDRLAAFLGRLVVLDRDRRLHQALFQRFSGPIRTLIDNRFVFDPFWRALRTHDASNRWETQFAASKKAALAAVVAGDTLRVLSIVFDRLYVLRNQLVHGGATWNGGVNRGQVRDGASILESVIPLLLGLMLEHADQDWGEINYPVV